MRRGNPTVRWPRDIATFVVIGVLLVGVSLLPPDTALRQVMTSGTLRVCVPTTYPPLVTADPHAPGIDLEILEFVASELGVRLQVVRNPAIGRSFNPRDWRVTRAQCLVLAGGIIDSTATRGFLSVTTPHIATGWAATTRDDNLSTLLGAQAAFFPGATGLDRIALGAWLRAQGAVVTIVSNEREARDGLVDASFDLIVSEALLARSLAADIDGRAYWLPVGDGRTPVAFGLWKGDLTLERAIERALRRARTSGTLHSILVRYDLAPIADECRFCL